MVETLDKPRQIQIPPGTGSGTILNLDRQGAHKLGNKSYRGSHYVHLQVRFYFRIFICFKIIQIYPFIISNKKTINSKINF